MQLKGWNEITVSEIFVYTISIPITMLYKLWLLLLHDEYVFE
jgi:hypothetical protein